MEKIKLGIIGVGSVVREIYQYLYYNSAYSDLLEIVAIADINEEYRNWFGNKYGIKEFINILKIVSDNKKSSINFENKCEVYNLIDNKKKINFRFM